MLKLSTANETTIRPQKYIMNFETLDTIADAYIPLLFIFTLAISTYSLWKNRDLLKPRVFSLIYISIVVYGCRYLDEYFQLFKRFNWDYSTHTAASALLATLLCVLIPKYRFPLIFSLVGYFYLMLYQEYHTLIDIGTTLILVLPLGCAGIYAAHRYRFT